MSLRGVLSSIRSCIEMNIYKKINIFDKYFTFIGLTMIYHFTRVVYLRSEFFYCSLFPVRSFLEHTRFNIFPQRTSLINFTIPTFFIPIFMFAYFVSFQVSQTWNVSLLEKYLPRDCNCSPHFTYSSGTCWSKPSTFHIFYSIEIEISVLIFFILGFYSKFVIYFKA